MVYMIVLSIIAGALGLYYVFFKDLNFFKKHGIPHVRPLPLFGNMAPIIFCRQSRAELLKLTYNIDSDAKYVGIYNLTSPVILLRDPELIKLITIKHFDTFMDRAEFVNETVDKLFGQNIFFLNGERWREVRGLLSPAFTSSKMRSMFKLILDCSVNFVNHLMQLPPEKKTMEMKNMFSRYTIDVISTCAFGISVDSMKNPDNKFYVYGKEAIVFNNALLLKSYIFKTLPWLAQTLKLKIVRKQIMDFFYSLIETSVNNRDQKGIFRSDMLQLMMEGRGKDDKPDLIIDDMVSQAFIFFFAGFDSSASALSFAAHEIAASSKIQKILQNEIDQVLEETNGQTIYEAINNMEYLDAVIMEVLRMYPLILAFDRKCLKDFELPPTLPGAKPFVLKEGQIVWIPVYGLHHDPKYFEEPEKFNPERFLGERKNVNFNCGAYFPFGLGPRKCIGYRFALLKMKTLLFHLLALCDLKPCEKTSLPVKLVKGGFIIGIEGGFWLNVLPRKNVHHTIARTQT